MCTFLTVMYACKLLVKDGYEFWRRCADGGRGCRFQANLSAPAGFPSLTKPACSQWWQNIRMGRCSHQCCKGPWPKGTGREGTECKSLLCESGWAEAGPFRYAEPNANKISGLGILHQFLDCRESTGIGARRNGEALVGVLIILPPCLRGGRVF